MSMKDKKVKSIVESDEENEQGACGVSNDPRRFSLAVPEPSSGSLLDDSVDNLSMEVHLGGDNSRHPSEISSVSYQNLLDDGEPSSSIISRRGSDDSLDSYPPDFPDAELPPDDLETFEASDLPLSEHFPMGAIQGADHREKSRGDRSIYVSDSSSNTSHPNVRLKDQPSSESLENIKRHEKIASEPCLDTDEASAKRSSFEIRNNIPLVGEVKDYEKELNVDFSRVQGHRSTLIGLKQSPGVAQRVEIDSQMDRDTSGNEVTSKQCEISAAMQQPPGKLRPKKTYTKTKENVIEVITPIPRNMNIENEYDYVKYARVQQGNSYVGMRLAYSSSSDSLSIKQGVYSEDNSREPSPEKNLQQKIQSDHGSQEKVCEESLMEIPLNSSDYPEDKKAFTLSPENTECDSVEVESVTSEGDNSTPGFPTLEDGLSSSQASDIDEAVAGASSDHSPSKLVKSKQKGAVDSDASKKDEDCRPKEMDAQAIMHDLKMKREALDMAIADIKSAIQRSKSMSLESSYPNQTESEANQPVWVKRVNKETTANQAKHRQEEMRRVREEIERQQEELSTSQGKPHPEKDLCEREKYVETLGDVVESGLQDLAATEIQDDSSETIDGTDVVFKECNKVFSSQIVEPLSEEVNEEICLDKATTASQVELIGDCIDKLQINVMTHHFMSTTSAHLHGNPSHSDHEFNALDSLQSCNEELESCSSVGSSINKNNFDTATDHYPTMGISQYQHSEHYETDVIHDMNEAQQIRLTDCDSENIPADDDICIDSSRGSELNVGAGSSLPCCASEGIFSLITSNSNESNIVERQEEESVNPKVPSFVFQSEVETEQLDNLVAIEEDTEPDYWSAKESEDGDNGCYESSTHIDVAIKEREDNEDSVAVRTDDDDDDDDQVGGVRLDGPPRGYDSDDECEDAEGIRYTRRNKGKKYAPLQKDDSLEMGGACGRRDVSKSNGHLLSSNHTSYSGSTGSLVNHKQLQQLQPQSGEHHIHSSEIPLSSEESSDIDANGNSYTRPSHADSDTDEETDRLLQKQYQERDKNVEIPELNDPDAAGRRTEAERRHSKAKEAAIRDPDRPEVLIEGVLFRARYLGSTQLISEGQPSKAMRMMQAQEAVGRIKTLGVLHFGERFQAPEGENQPSTDVDLFVSTEKIMVLNTDLQEIMMDHSLRTISYIADIGDILVIMARRRLITSPDDMMGRRRRQAKILCHVFESDEAQLIAQSIGQAFQVAYLEFLKANGIEDPGLLKEMDYQDVLNQQEIYGEELNLFANKDFHKEVIVPKSKNEPLSVVIVESGWGSMVPTVVLANMLPSGPAARCGQLNIGDQIISINGVSLVGLPLSACQTYIKSSRSQTVVKLTVVPCPPVVEVLIKRPDVKYQLGFSVQNGVICSLLRGGIAERGGVRVGHRIIEINNQSVVAVPHEKIVTLLASSVGEIHMKTMPTSIFRLLTGQDVPHYL